MSTNRITVASLSARMDERDKALDAKFDRLESLILGLGAQNAPAEPAKTARRQDVTQSPGRKASSARINKRDELAKARREAKATTEKAYRSLAGKERAKADVAALWEKTLADAGVTKRAQLTDAQFASYQAGAKAIWAAVPKTRSTKA